MPISRVGSMYDSLQNRGVPIMPFVYIGFVKDNADAQRMGRLSVWIPEMGGDPADEASWIICSYASPFAGATDITRVNNYTTSSTVAQQSYGMWMVPPDLNNEVCVFFANGELARGYWFACSYQQSMNWMVPGIAINVTTEPSPPLHISPVIEYNKAAANIDPDKPRRPPFQPLTDGLYTEGLQKDLERGVASTSARREAPSEAFGFLTPRGNTIHIDDADDNEFIRMRTRSGAQILIHETTGYVYINSKNGNSWLEVSDGGIAAYSSGPISVRSQNDVNIRSDRSIFLDADQNISLRAAQNITMEAGNNLQIKVAKDTALSTGGNLNISVQNNLNLQTFTDTNIKTGGTIRLDSGSRLYLQSSGNTFVKANANLIVQSLHNLSLKAAQGNYRDGASIVDNGGKSSAADDAAAPVASSPTVASPGDQLDTSPKLVGDKWTWTASGGKVSTITSQMPTHEPWPGHPNSKVPPPPLEDVAIDYQPTYGVGDSSNNGTELDANNTSSVAGTDANDSGCNFGAANTTACSTEVFNAIIAASSKTGANAATMLAFADIESSFKPGAGAKSSSATGLFQFTRPTWDSMVKQYGSKYNVSPDGINDPVANSLMGGQFLQDNAERLQKNGIEVNPGNLYMMHFMGSGGGPQFIKAMQQNPNADASSSFPTAASANPTIFRGRSLRQVYDLMTNKANSKANAYASQIGQPAPCIRSTGTPAGAPEGSGGSSPANTLLPSNFQQYKGQQIGNGECVTLLQQVGKLPLTNKWKPGDPPNSSTPIGTPLATFQNGHYVGHCGFFNGMLPDGSGFTMVDQYNVPTKTAVGVRTYTPQKSGVMNSTMYRVINL